MASRGPRNVRVGKNLRTLRTARGMSQEAMADKLEYDRTYLAGIERGERNLSLETLSKLAAQLGVEALELLQADDPAEES